MDKKMKGVVANVRMEVQRECEANVRNAKSEMQEQIWEKDARLERFFFNYLRVFLDFSNITLINMFQKISFVFQFYLPRKGYFKKKKRIHG